MTSMRILNMDASLTVVWTLLVLLTFHGSSVSGHGRLINPASRSSLWRFGYTGAATNYNDNQLYCGGFQNQQKFGGKCGACGDPYQGPRDNEAGGKYAKKIIAGRYREGDVIDVEVEITANHKGWFEFRVCPNNNFNKAVTHGCLNRYLLPLADGSGTRNYIGTTTGKITTKLQLPWGLHCTQCVIQWKYHAANSWGTDPGTGRGCVGCGPQEEFYGCADITIRPRNPGQGNVTMPSAASTATPTTPSTTTPAPGVDPQHTGRVCKAAGSWKGDKDMDQWCVANCAANYCPDTHCKCENVPDVNPPAPSPHTVPPQPQTTQGAQQHGGAARCRAIGAYKGSSAMDAWCVSNCAVGNCPITHCSCSRYEKVCKAIGDLAARAGMDTWCTANCLAGNCPPDKCECRHVDVGVPTTAAPSCLRYKAVNKHAGDDVMDAYCQMTCKLGECPVDVCACAIYAGQAPPFKTSYYQCEPTAAYKDIPNMDSYCQVLCSSGQKNCPWQYCICSKVTIGYPIDVTTDASVQQTTARTVSKRACKAYGPYEGQTDAETHCQACQGSQCSSTKCLCSDDDGVFPFLPAYPSTNTSCMAADAYKHTNTMVLWCMMNCLAGQPHCTSNLCDCSIPPSPQTVPSNDDNNAVTTTPKPPQDQKTQPSCKRYAAIGSYAGDRIMNAYCSLTCSTGTCSRDVCGCSVEAGDSVTQSPSESSCEPRQAYINLPHFTELCNALCSAGSCPSSHCSCQNSP